MTLGSFSFLTRAIIKILKITTLVLLLVAVLVSGWVYWGSIDAESFNDHGLFADYHRKPDDKHQNGVYDIPFVLNRKYESPIDGRSRRQLKYFLVNVLWDKEKAHQYRSPVTSNVAAVIQSLKKPYYQFPEHNDSDLRDSISHSAVDELYLSLLLESQWQYFENDNVAEALSYLKAAMQFNARLANAQGLGFLASSIAGQNRAVVYPWLSVLTRAASKEQLAELRGYLQDINRKHDKALSGAFAADFMMQHRYFSSELMQNSVFTRRPFAEGLAFKTIDWDYRWLMVKGFFNGLFKLSYHNSSWVYFLNDYVPRFYNHKNRHGEVISKLQADLKSQAFLSCNKKNLAGNPTLNQGLDQVTTGPWYLPNHIQYIDFPERTYRQYQIRKCWNRQWGEVLAATLAIASYELDNGELPDSLEQLQPNYLDEIPEDIFNGETLGYSKQQHWLYASGMNYLSQGGSVDTLVPTARACFRQPCVNNPTYALYDQRPFPMWTAPATGDNTVQWRTE